MYLSYQVGTEAHWLRYENNLSMEERVYGGVMEDVLIKMVFAWVSGFILGLVVGNYLYNHFTKIISDRAPKFSLAKKS